MLTDTHRKMLEVESAISPEIVDARGYESVTADSDRLSAFAQSQRRSGLLVPGWDVFGRQHTGQLRPDVPRTITKGGKPHELKYESARGSAAYLDVHPAVRDRVANGTGALVITEGCKKADSAVTAGLACVALLGVWGWRGKQDSGATAGLADFDRIPLHDRKTILAFDSDVVEKREVITALKRFTAYLERYGAKVFIVTWEKV